ncbi:hypothetical protein F5Y15DRAFT_207681 [Xylariaceae sp. FL0016]|nr:hypothetical protein F5Y15DRAFT_207681 [Xylariaceae sp. FL0016]
MTPNFDAADWKVELVPDNDDGRRFWLENYKPFRLASLLADPQAFGSTYAREIAFADQAWLDRIQNPLSKTFVAVHAHDTDRRVMSATSLIGPLPSAEPSSNPRQWASEMISREDHRDRSGEPMSFQMAGVYTRAEARGRGLAKTLIRRATDYAVEQAHKAGRPLSLSVVVYASNEAAVSVYESCGFARDPQGPVSEYNPLKQSSSETLNMFFSRDSTQILRLIMPKLDRPAGTSLDTVGAPQGASAPLK